MRTQKTQKGLDMQIERQIRGVQGREELGLLL